MKTYYIDSRHVLNYSISGLPTICGTSDSLIGVEKISRHLPLIFSSALGDIPMPQIEVYICSVKTGSQTEDFIFRFIFGSEKAKNTFIEQIRTRTGIKTMNKQLPLVGPTFMLLLLTGGAYAVGHMFGREGGTNGTTVHLEKCRQTVILQGASTLRIEPAAFEKLVHDKTGNPFNVASNACRVLSPVKHGGGGLTVDGDNNLVITPEAVQELPQRLDRDSGQPLVDKLDNVVVNIRALDLDSRAKGWAVVVPSVSKKRLKLELDSGVDASVITGGITHADIDLYYGEDEEGNRFYKSAVLREVKK